MPVPAEPAAKHAGPNSDLFIEASDSKPIPPVLLQAGAAPQSQSYLTRQLSVSYLALLGVVLSCLLAGLLIGWLCFAFCGRRSGSDSRSRDKAYDYLST